MSKFKKEVEKRLTPLSPSDIIAKVHKRTQSIFKSAVGTYELQQQKDEDAVEKAKEKLDNIIYVVSIPDDENSYLKSILEAKNAVAFAEEVLESTKATVTFLKELYSDK